MARRWFAVLISASRSGNPELESQLSLSEQNDYALIGNQERVRICYLKARKKSIEFTFIMVQGNHRQPFETTLIRLS
jgi:hypothetical protein